jgi:HipA N-terminal domain
VRDCAVGYLMQVEDYVFFEWDSQYWDDPHREILGLAFEDHPRMRVASNVRLPAWFSNLLPEGILREWIARHYGVNPAREMEILRQIGSDLPGAVRVYDLPDEPD